MARKNAPKPSAAADIIQIKVTLRGVKPPVWRRLLMPGGMTLADLHTAIQAAMGWGDCHLHLFYVGSGSWGDLESVEDAGDERIPKLSGLLLSGCTRMAYTYDFGDDWEHDIAFEKSGAPAEGQSYPACVAGKRRCPPEDCGGVWGYQDLLDILGNPEDPEHEDRIEWLGGPFDPNEFNLERTNAAVAARFRKPAHAAEATRKD